MPDDHRPAMSQVTAVDGQFGTHRVRAGRSGRAGRSLNATVPGETPSGHPTGNASCPISRKSAIEAAPATIPATTEALFAPAFATALPAKAGTRTPLRPHATQHARPAATPASDQRTTSGPVHRISMIPPSRWKPPRRTSCLAICRSIMDVGELRHDGKGCNTRIDAAVRKVAGQRSRTAYKYFPGSRRVRSSVESALNGNAKGGA
jgi:uncharacterized protein (DUF4415 family)